ATPNSAVSDDRHAARLAATRILAGAELKDAEGKVEAFETRRHLWKFQVEGIGKVSLREVEQRMKAEQDEQFKLYNFLRPSKRTSIRLRIEFLQETKRDVQKQIVAAEQPARTNLAATRLIYETASKLAEQTAKRRAESGKEMPPPALERVELSRIAEIANHNKSAPLLQFVYDQVKESLLAHPSVETLSDAKGKALLARLDMLKAADRLKSLTEYGDYRQVPIKDASGLTNTRTV